MSATADGDEAADREYFRAIEDAFVELRGAPLLLSPTDFQVAARWRRAGVPVTLVVATLEEVFARRRERGTKGRINSLRYCAPAVEQAWSEVRELQGPSRATAAEIGLDVAARVRELAAATALRLAPGSPLAERAAQELATIAAEAADPEAVEARLRALDDALLAAADAALDEAGRLSLAREVEAIVDGLRARVPAEELEAVRRQLRRQRLRRLVGLPLLTLFGGA